ncbi:hypothetical protein HJFPF1_12249 [Paramyrothecium foliicola]|nr:hypothetical protein HJFPF1_12249 [Paramyrothecium foliicola]
MVFDQATRKGGSWSARFQYRITPLELNQKGKICYCCHGIGSKLASKDESQFTDDMVLEKTYGLWVPFGREDIARINVSVNIENKTVVTQPLCLQSSQNEASCTSSSTGSEDTLQFVRDCLNQCETQHTTCSSTIGGDTWYPTRLIEVRNDSLRLVESAETSISKPYASLSHCWGGAKILNLTTENIDELKGAIDLNLLPQTFKDAIRFVRGLGINYIWIDSLCIVQDSAEDWKKEAHAMLQVYRHAVCNIAATDSKDSFSGLFRERNPVTLASGAVEIDNGVLKGSYQLVDERYFMHEVDGAPINRRSWVTQERMLSPRIAHFASEQVIWDCAELTASEALPQGTKIWPECGWGQTKIGCKQGRHSLMHPETIEQGLGQWARVVETYSDCGLTFPGDKLVAISGMAEYLRSLLEMEYCVGLWRPKLEMQLAWTVANTQRTGSLRNDLAPTWSWISINGGVKLQQVDAYAGYDLKLFATVTHVEVCEQADEGRGTSATGYLHLRCVLNAVTIEGNPTSPRLCGENMEHARGLLLDSPHIIGASQLFFVPLFEVKTPYSPTNSYAGYSEIRGIVIHCIEEVSGIYERCGHALLSSTTLKDMRSFPPSYNKCDETLPSCINCVTADRTCSFLSSRPRRRVVETEIGTGTATPSTLTSTPYGSSIVTSPFNLHPGAGLDKRGGDASPASGGGLPAPPSGQIINIQHLSLLHHLENEVFRSPQSFLLTDAQDAELCYEAIFRAAVSAPYLMYELLAFSALHWSTRPGEEAQRKELAGLASELQTSALTLLNATGPEVRDENCMAMLVFSSLLGMHALFDAVASYQNSPEFLDKIVHYLKLHRGVRAVTNQSWQVLRNSEIRRCIDPIEAGDEERRLKEQPAPQCHRLRSLLDAWSDKLGSTTYDICLEAVRSLSWVFDLHASLSSPYPVHITIAWPVLVSAEFVELLEQRQPVALIILAHWAILLHAEREFWVFNDAGRVIIQFLSGHLGSYWEEWLAGPMEVQALFW